MEPLTIAQRLGRGKLRESRSRSFGTKVTPSEERELTAAALNSGGSASEWAREVLLREARRSPHDPVFVELIATRMLLLNLLKPLAFGKTITEKDFTNISTLVRNEKRKAADEIQQQYQLECKKER